MRTVHVNRSRRSSYINRIGEHHLQSGGTKAEPPKPGSVPFFLSYFWQAQERDIWPVYSLAVRSNANQDDSPSYG